MLCAVPEGSWPCSQKPASCPYSKSYELNSHAVPLISTSILSTPTSPEVAFLDQFRPVYLAHVIQQWHNPKTSHLQVLLWLSPKIRYCLSCNSLILPVRSGYSFTSAPSVWFSLIVRDEVSYPHKIMKIWLRNGDPKYVPYVQESKEMNTVQSGGELAMFQKSLLL